MTMTTRIVAIAIMIVALVVLAFPQWLPALFFLPVGTAMLMWDGSKFSIDQRQDRPAGWQNDYALFRTARSPIGRREPPHDVHDGYARGVSDHLAELPGGRGR